MSSQTMERDNSLKKVIVGCALTAILAIGGVYAYLTATDTVTNKLSVETKPLAIQVVEPGWNTTDADNDGVPDAAEDMLPGASITKDPRVKNTTDGEIPAWMAAQVSVPMYKGEPLYTYELNASKWKQVSAEVDGDNLVYTYLYTGGKVAKGSQTEPIFTTVTLKNVSEIDTALSGVKMIDVTGFGIQASAFDNVDDAWTSFAKDYSNLVTSGTTYEPPAMEE